MLNILIKLKFNDSRWKQNKAKEETMTEIGFLSFLVLLVISVVVALLIQYVARIEPIKGIRG